VLALFDVIKKCLTLNPRKRITVEELLKHPFFVDVVVSSAPSTASSGPAEK
jgi:serine/threonine protein kinase